MGLERLDQRGSEERQERELDAFAPLEVGLGALAQPGDRRDVDLDDGGELRGDLQGLHHAGRDELPAPTHLLHATAGVRGRDAAFLDRGRCAGASGRRSVPLGRPGCVQLLPRRGRPRAARSAAASTSDLRMRPPTPVPVTVDRSTPFSLASLRTSGVTYVPATSSSSASASGAAEADRGAGACAGGGRLRGRRGLRGWWRLSRRRGLCGRRRLCGRCGRLHLRLGGDLWLRWRWCRGFRLGFGGRRSVGLGRSGRLSVGLGRRWRRGAFRLGFRGTLLDRRRRRILSGRIADDGELDADIDRLVLLDLDRGQHAGGRRGHLGVDLVGGDLQQRLVGLDMVSFVLQPAGHGAFGDALTEARHGHGDRHGCNDSFGWAG